VNCVQANQKKNSKEDRADGEGLQRAHDPRKPGRAT